jgi:hypothetical protein
MSMYRSIGLMILSFVACVSALPRDTVLWATPEWEGLVHKDGKGLYFELVREAFAYSKTVVKPIFVPWARAEYLVKSNQADFYGGIEKTNLLPQSQIPILIGVESAFFKKKPTFKWEGLKSLKNYQGSWTRRYTEFIDPALKSLLQGTEMNTKEMALRMVDAGRADYFLDNAFDAQFVFQKLRIDTNLYIRKDLQRTKVFMAFAQNPKSRQRLIQFDAGLRQMIQSGRYRALFQKYGRECP